jgi:preprotein translocase subunit SecB
MGAADSDIERRVGIKRIYIKDASFESPNVPAVLNKEWKPKFTLNMGTQAKSLEDDDHEVVLNMTVEAKLNDEVAFVAEVQQAGVFTLEGFNVPESERILAGFCTSEIFPYAREAIASMVARGGFPQLMLQPVNFDALYQQQKAKQAAGATS